jgi:diacylglycerol kinase (ATP)
MNNPEKRRLVDRIKTIEERLLIIVNPVSRKGSMQASSVRSMIRREGMYLEETSTDHPDDMGATIQFWSRRFGGSKVIMVFGGDGAINQVINNVMLSKSNKNVVLVPVPAGTANDFCRALGFDTAEGALSAMVDFNIRPIDLIRIEVNGTTDQVKYCSNIIGVGLDGDLARRSQKYKKFGVIGYWYASLKHALICVFRGMNTWKVRLRAGEYTYEGDLIGAMFSNINKYGRNLLIAPGARLDDGKIYVTVAKPMSAPVALGAALSMVLGKHDRFPKVSTLCCEEADIELLDDVYSQEDGEVFLYPRGTNFHISLEHAAINVLCGPAVGSNGS